MSDDIVARLRNWPESMPPTTHICAEAADEIERLRASAQVGETKGREVVEGLLLEVLKDAAHFGSLMDSKHAIEGTTPSTPEEVARYTVTHRNVGLLADALAGAVHYFVPRTPVPEATDDLDALREAWESGAVTRILDHGGMFFGWTEDGDVGVFTMAGAMAGRSPSIAKGDTAWDAIVALRAALALSTPTDSESGE